MDGWSTDVQDTLEGIFGNLERLMYEVRNCRRGSYTQCDTNEQLAEYIHELADDLSSVADYLDGCEDNSEMEE